MSNHRIPSYLSFLLALAGPAVSQGQQKSIRPERAQAILLDSLRTTMQATVGLRYRATIPGRRGVSTETSDWILSGTLARWRARETRRVGGEVAHVETTDLRASTRITRKPGGWIAVRRLRGADNLLNSYCPLQVCYHGFNGQSIADLLVNNPPMQAWRTARGIRVLIPLVQTLAADLRNGDEISGFLAWDCTFLQKDGRYVLQRIRDLETPKVFDPRGKGDVGWIDNPRRRSGTSVETILGGTAALGTDETWFEDFVSVGGVTLPLKMHSASKEGTASVEIDVLSLQDVRDRVDESSFRFAVPEGFGANGRYFDNESGDVRYYGMRPGRELAAVQKLIAGGRRMGAAPEFRAPHSFYSARTLTGGAALLALLAGCGLLFCGRRRRHAR